MLSAEFRSTLMQAEPTAISTGQLPPDEIVRSLVEAAHTQFKGVDEGLNAQHYPALAAVPAGLFGICLASVGGQITSVGDADHPFTIMSVAKPFVFALVCDAIGPEELRARVGVNATGLPFNSVMALELHPDRLTNPMVNTGAMATTSLVPGDTAAAKWQAIQRCLSRFAGRPLQLNDEIFACAMESNHRNRGLARFLEGYDRLAFDAEATVEIYTRQSSLDVTARDLAVMGATLANGGINPLTGEAVVSATACRLALAVMTTAGMYETSGDWLYDIGLPGKSGVGGGIITVAPGKGGMASFAPPLDAAGNSVRGQLAARFLSDKLGLNLFASRPAAVASYPSLTT
jgi:glutaminase